MFAKFTRAFSPSENLSKEPQSTPSLTSEMEILSLIFPLFNTVKPEKPSDMGKLMGFVTPKLKGKADMSFVSKTIKEKLANL